MREIQEVRKAKGMWFVSVLSHRQETALRAYGGVSYREHYERFARQAYAELTLHIKNSFGDRLPEWRLLPKEDRDDFMYLAAISLNERWFTPKEIHKARMDIALPREAFSNPDFNLLNAHKHAMPFADLDKADQAIYETFSRFASVYDTEAA